MIVDPVLGAALLVAQRVERAEFFPKVEPDYGQVVVHARGNLALDEKNRLVGEVEKRVLAFDGLKTVYTRIGEQPRGMSELTEDTIGVILFEFADWRSRPPAHEIMDAIRAKTADIAGILIEVTAPRAGPPTGKPIPECPRFRALRAVSIATEARLWCRCSVTTRRSGGSR